MKRILLMILLFYIIAACIMGVSTFTNFFYNDLLMKDYRTPKRMVECYGYSWEKAIFEWVILVIADPWYYIYIFLKYLLNKKK